MGKQSLFLDRKTKCWESMPILFTFICRFNVISVKSQQKDKKDKLEWIWGEDLLYQILIQTIILLDSKQCCIEPWSDSPIHEIEQIVQKHPLVYIR